jgi:serine protease Do
VATTGILLTIWSDLSFALTPEEMFKKLSPSITMVIVYDGTGKPTKIGSAVVIGHESLLTNCHVLAKGKSIQVKQDNATFGAELVYLDIERDLCQIKARNLRAAPVTLADSDTLQVGQKVYSLGNPKGLELTLGDGLLSSLRRDSKGQLRWIQTSAPISSGSSGGGLFDDKGRLIGITTMALIDGQALNFAIPINVLNELPERSRTNMAKLTGRQTAESSGPSTMLGQGAADNR